MENLLFHQLLVSEIKLVSDSNNSFIFAFFGDYAMTFYVCCNYCRTENALVTHNWEPCQADPTPQTLISTPEIASNTAQRELI